jgi:hypothetical protein
MWLPLGLLSLRAPYASFRLKAEATHENVHEPEDPDVDEPDDEVDEPVLVEDDEDVLSLVDDVPEEAAGLVSPEDLASPEDFLA